MTNIYDQHRTAFANVSAFVVLDNKGERTASVAFKFPRDGAGRLYCYVHVFGLEMVRGFAGGYGYDKRSAAFKDACGRIKVDTAPAAGEAKWAHEAHAEKLATASLWRSLVKDVGGRDWDRVLVDAGFRVLGAV